MDLLMLHTFCRKYLILTRKKRKYILEELLVLCKSDASWQSLLSFCQTRIKLSQNPLLVRKARCWLYTILNLMVLTQCLAVGEEERIVRSCGWLPNPAGMEDRDCFTRTGTHQVRQVTGRAARCLHPVYYRGDEYLCRQLTLLLRWWCTTACVGRTAATRPAGRPPPSSSPASRPPSSCCRSDWCQQTCSAQTGGISLQTTVVDSPAGGDRTISTPLQQWCRV